MATDPFVITLPPETIDALAERVARLVLASIGTAGDRGHQYMTVAEAADYLRCSRQRIYDLRSSGRLSRIADGSRALISRAELDEYLFANETLREE